MNVRARVRQRDDLGLTPNAHGASAPPLADPLEMPGIERVAPLRSGAVSVWASFGVLWLVYIVVGLTYWVLASDEFGPAPAGSDHLSDTHLVLIRGFEVLSILVCLGFIWRYLIKPWRETGRLTPDGMIVIGTTCAYFIDPVVNLFEYTFAWNAHALNVGSWGSVFPLVESSQRFGEGLAWALPQYVYFGLGGALFGCYLFERLQARRPNITKAQCFAIYLAIFFVFDTILEYACIRFELYSYARCWAPLTLDDGSQYQWPLYEGLISGVYSAGFLYVRWSWKEKGTSFVDAGIDRLGLSGRSRTTVLLLAVVGFSAVWAFVAWFAPWSWQSTSANAISELPSYLQAGR